MKIGVMFGNPETTPGGRALKFFASIRLDMRKIANITDSSDNIVGSRHRVRVVKNKVAPPFRQSEFDIMNVGGISRTGDLVDLAEQYNIIEKAGSFYKFEGKVLAQGREGAKDTLGGDSKLFHAVKTKVVEALASGQPPK